MTGTRPRSLRRLSLLSPSPVVVPSSSAMESEYIGGGALDQCRPDGQLRILLILNRTSQPRMQLPRAA